MQRFKPKPKLPLADDKGPIVSGGFSLPPPQTVQSIPIQTLSAGVNIIPRPTSTTKPVDYKPVGTVIKVSESIAKADIPEITTTSTTLPTTTLTTTTTESPQETTSTEQSVFYTKKLNTSEAVITAFFNTLVETSHEMKNKVVDSSENELLNYIRNLGNLND